MHMYRCMHADWIAYSLLAFVAISRSWFAPVHLNPFMPSGLRPQLFGEFHFLYMGCLVSFIFHILLLLLLLLQPCSVGFSELFRPCDK